MTPAWAQRQEELRRDCIVSPDVFQHIVDRLSDFAVPYQHALTTEAGQRNVLLYLRMKEGRRVEARRIVGAVAAGPRCVARRRVEALGAAQVVALADSFAAILVDGIRGYAMP